MLNYQDFREYDNHFKVVQVKDESVGLNGFIAIHRSRVGFPALGATRLWSYASEEEALKDALRLSKLMTYKSVLAGLPYTGAKAALIFSSQAHANREAMFRAYAHAVNELGGKFITGTDVGVSNKDLDIMFEESKYMIGEGIDSGYFTAVAVLDGIRLALKSVFGDDDIGKYTFAIQGLGKTGGPLLDFLVKANAKKIFVTDINPRRAWYAKLRHPFIRFVGPLEIFSKEVDVLCPCALSSAINAGNVSHLKCKIIAGSANNQLDNNQTGELLFKKGILYAPDFVINGGGLISVADQLENKKHDKDRVLKKLEKVKESLQAIFLLSKKKNMATNLVASEIADGILKTYSLE